jgi:helix-turn-helix protein
MPPTASGLTVPDVMAASELIGVRAAAELLGVHENTVRNWQASGFLHAATWTVSGYRKFTRAEIERVQGVLNGKAGDLADDQLADADVGILVRLRLPPGMTPRQAMHEVAVGVGFGSPRVSLHFVKSPAGYPLRSRRGLSRTGEGSA